MRILTRRPMAWAMILALGACGGGEPSAPASPAADLAATPSAAGTILLQDDFSGPSIDPARWVTYTNIPQGGARVLVDGGHAVLLDRGYLTTYEEFSPRALGGLRISGDWRVAGAPDDFLQILTRTDGAPDPGNPYGEATLGIEFLAFTSEVVEDPSLVTINGRGRAEGSVTLLSSSGHLVITPGRIYHFEAVDLGDWLSLTITDVLNPQQTRTVTATSPYPGDRHHVTFHNRERCCMGDHRAMLDNILIEGSVE